ncbi:hypothetical protein AYK25_07600 [Thermoplasmatales archaeon SM1-50]|nr:MAG: hypothetical protein AYK25_07600 [Thermoplasmatales archaeon SM1-50]
MLSDKERKKIINLIKQGKTNYRISKETVHSVNTIQHIREELEENEKKQTQIEEACFNSPIEATRGFIAQLEKFIQMKKFSDKEKKEWGERLEQLREIIQEEVDDRINIEREDAVKKRDQDWNKLLEQSYIKKEAATNLENLIHERDTIIKNLKTTIEEKDHFIDTRLEKDVIRYQKHLSKVQKVFDAEKTRFTKDAEIQYSYVNNLFFAAVEKQEANKTREKQLDEREEKIKKQEVELETNK